MIQSGLAYRAAQRLQKADNAAVVLARRPTGRLCQSALAGGSLRRRVKPRCSSCDIRSDVTDSACERWAGHL